MGTDNDYKCSEKVNNQSGGILGIIGDAIPRCFFMVFIDIAV